MALTTKIKMAINAILKPVGLQIGTTLKERIELARLNKLLAKGHWAVPRYAEGLQLDSEKYLEFARRVCTAYKSIYTSFPKKAEEGTETFYLQNDGFGGIDAEMLYCMVRHFQPRQIVEVGCGFSTCLLRKAIGEGKLKTRLTCIDPNPRINVAAFADELIQQPVEEADAAKIVNSLGSNDLLFIDSSHVVMTGGDIPYLYLELLPRMKEGLLLHIHDMFIPYDYSIQWVLEERRGYTEQYLVQAILSYSEAFEILWPSQFMWKNRQKDVLEIFPNGTSSLFPTSLWLRKCGSV